MFDRLKYYAAVVGAVPLGLQGALSTIVRAARPKPPTLETTCAPIVLMHGIAGFREIGAPRSPLLEYFAGVRPLLTAMGYQVFAPEVSPFDDPLDRAKQWMTEIEKIRKKTGAPKVHLVGHSQGGLDARVLVAPTAPSATQTPLGPLMGLGYGPHVASLTTISTPHLGSAIADEFDQDSPIHKDAVERLFHTVSLLARLTTGTTQDAPNAVRSLSHGYINGHFNSIIKDDPDVPCYAIAGNPYSARAVHWFLRPTYYALEGMDPREGGGPNDSLVTVASGLFGNLPDDYVHLNRPEIEAQRRPHWQTVGIIQADHVAQVGLELLRWPSDAYDHLSFFAGLAQRLDPACTAEMRLLKDGRWVREPEQRAVPVRVAVVGS